MSAVKLLSAPGVFHAGERLRLPRGKTSALLFYLAYQRKWVSREDLCYLFWPDTIERRAKTNLRQLILTIKQLPYVNTLEVTSTHLHWPIDTDVQTFRDAVSEQHWQRASDLYEGGLLEGLKVDGIPEFESWLELERFQLFSLYSDAISQLCKTLAAEGRYGEAAEHFANLHALEPFDESIFRHYLNYLNLSGKRDKALHAYAHFKDSLALELGYDPAPATQQLVERVGAREQEGASLEQASPHSTLPESTTPFVGREAEIDQVIEQFTNPSCRLLNLVAPGGMGKTRLALEVAKRCAASFEDGACFIPFEAVISPDLMVPAAAKALNVSFSGQGFPKDELLNHLKDKRLLLVLDNLEHLLPDTSLITDLLTKAPKIKLLVTSRENLNLQAEWLFDLEGMQVPEANSQNLQETDAVKLFVQAAKRVHANFNLSEENVDTILSLCQQVGGMPLALELAASWLRILSPEDVLKELEQGLGILYSSANDLPQRHLDIRTVFEASWSRLAVGAQVALQKLAVFEGGFTKEAAHEVAEVGLPLLLLLVNKAFLKQDSSRRFSPHPLMWQFIRQKAEGTPPFTETQDQHAHYYMTFTQQYEWSYRGKEVKKARDEVNLELPNIRRAWNYSTEYLREDLLGQANLALFFHFLMESRFAEGAAFFNEASETLSSESLVQARILHHHGALLYLAGNFETSRPLLERSLVLKRQHNATWDIAQGLMSLGFNYQFSDHVTREEHVKLWRECAAVCGASGDKDLQGLARTSLAAHLVNPHEREDILRRALSDLREQQGYFELAPCLELLAKHLAYSTGAFQEATDLLTEAVTIEYQKGSAANRGTRLNVRGRALLYQGRLKAAERCFCEVLTITSDTYHVGNVISSLNHLAYLMFYKGYQREAQDYLQRAFSLSENMPATKALSGSFDVFGYFPFADYVDNSTLRLKNILRRVSQLKNHNLEVTWCKIHILNHYGQMVLKQGDEAAAKQHFQTALRLSQTWHFRPAILHLLPSFAMLYQKQDGVADARQLLDFALKDTASMFQTKDIAQHVLKSLPESDEKIEPEQHKALRLEHIITKLIETNETWLSLEYIASSKK